MAKSITIDNGALAQQNLRNALTKLQTGAVDMVLNSAGLAIKTGGSAVVKTANIIKFMIDGVLYSEPAGDQAAIAGTIAAGKKAAFVFVIGANGTPVTVPSNLDAATLAAIVFPAIPAGTVVIGFLIVENGTASNFVGGTTALDATDITTTYVNTPFPFNPNMLSL